MYWKVLQDVPGTEHDVSAEGAGAQHGERRPADTLRRFVDFCIHFTSTAEWERHIPDSMHGAHALVVLQARHDKFVFFEDGVKLFEDLRRVASAPPCELQEARCAAFHARSPRNRREAVRADRGDDAPLLEGMPGGPGGSGRDAELIEVAGGHVAGFLQCPWLLPSAVLTALQRLQAKQGLDL